MTQPFVDSRNGEHAMKCELAAQVLRSFGKLRLEVSGLSMLPSVRPGDILFIERSDMREISAGDTVLFARQGKLVAHRVISKSARGDMSLVITQGDGLLSPDDPVSPAELLGKVCQILRDGEFVELAGDPNFWARGTYKLVRRFTWVARIMGFVHRLQGYTWRRKAFCKN
jgi:signal peptidase I